MRSCFIQPEQIDWVRRPEKEKEEGGWSSAWHHSCRRKNCRLSLDYSPAETGFICNYLCKRKLPLEDGCWFCEWAAHTLSKEVQNKLTRSTVHIYFQGARSFLIAGSSGNIYRNKGRKFQINHTGNFNLVRNRHTGTYMVAVYKYINYRPLLRLSTS